MRRSGDTKRFRDQQVTASSKLCRTLHVNQFSSPFNASRATTMTGHAARLCCQLCLSIQDYELRFGDVGNHDRFKWLSHHDANNFKLSECGEKCGVMVDFTSCSAEATCDVHTKQQRAQRWQEQEESYARYFVPHLSANHVIKEL